MDQLVHALPHLLALGLDIDRLVVLMRALEQAVRTYCLVALVAEVLHALAAVDAARANDDCVLLECVDEGVVPVDFLRVQLVGACLAQVGVALLAIERALVRPQLVALLAVLAHLLAVVDHAHVRRHRLVRD